ncbi:MAG: hypothetical protein ABII01_06140 [Candidatus Woesearchaeota archaeon]
MIKNCLIVFSVFFLVIPIAISSYPEPYVENGEFNSIIILGEEGSYYDGISANKLGEALGAVSSGKARVASYNIGDLHVYGDAFQVRQNGDILEGSEFVHDVINILDSSHLEMLKDGEFSTSKGNFVYDQTLEVPGGAYNSLEYARGIPDDDSNIPKGYMLFNSSYVYTYTLSFIDTPISEIDTAANGYELKDFEKSDITMLGKEFFLIDTDHNANNSVVLTLLSGAEKGVLQEGEKKEYELNGEKYEIELVAVQDVAPSTALFKINGVSTNSILEGNTDIVNGMQITVSEIIPNEAGDVTLDLVEFYLDSYKVVLKDTDVSSTSTGGQQYKVNDETIDDTRVEIVAEDDGRIAGEEFKLNQIIIRWAPSQTHYVETEQYLSEVLEERDALFGNLDYYFYGSNPNNEIESVDLIPKGNNEYVLKFENLDSELLEVPLFYNNDGSFTRFGNSNHALVVDEVRDITQNDFFLVTTDGSANPTEAKGLTKLFQYKGQDVSENTLKFKNMGTGEVFKINYNATDSLNVGGEEFIISVKQSAVNNGNISIDLNKDGSIDSGDVPVLVTKYLAKIVLDANTFSKLEVISPDSEEGVSLAAWAPYGVTEGHDYFLISVGSDSRGNIDIGALGRCLSSNLDEMTVALGAGLAAVVQAGCYNTWTNVTYSFLKRVGTTDNYDGAGAWGSFVELYKDNNGPDTIYIAGAKKMDETLFFITDTNAEFELIEEEDEESNASVFGLTSKNIILDSDITSKKNIISVGGPCINQKTAEIMGLNYPTCGDLGVGPGEALIKEYDYEDGKVLVVFGYDSLDTFNAVEKLNSGIELYDNSVLIKGDIATEFTGLIEKKVEKVMTTTTTLLESTLGCDGGALAIGRYDTQSRKFGVRVNRYTDVSIDMKGLNGVLTLTVNKPFKSQLGVDFLDYSIHIRQDDCFGNEVQLIDGQQTEGEQVLIHEIIVPEPGCYCMYIENEDFFLDSASIELKPTGTFMLPFGTS